MTKPNQSDVARILADAMIAARFGSLTGLTTVSDYLDHLDDRTTAHLPDALAARVKARTGKQRREARLEMDGSEPIILIPLNDPRKKQTVWAVLYFSTWLHVMECGADGAWFYAYKSPDRDHPQVRTTLPLQGEDRVSNTTISRVIANAKAGQTVRAKDGNPLNLRSENVWLDDRPATVAGKAGRAKTDTRSKAREKAALRASLPRKASLPC